MALFVPMSLHEEGLRCRDRVLLTDSPLIGGDSVVFVRLHRLQYSRVAEDVSECNLSGCEHLLHVAFARSFDSKFPRHLVEQVEMLKVIAFEDRNLCAEGLVVEALDAIWGPMKWRRRLRCSGTAPLFVRKRTGLLVLRSEFARLEASRLTAARRDRIRRCLTIAFRNVYSAMMGRRGRLRELTAADFLFCFGPVALVLALRTPLRFPLLICAASDFIVVHEFLLGCEHNYDSALQFLTNFGDCCSSMVMFIAAALPCTRCLAAPPPAKGATQVTIECATQVGPIRVSCIEWNDFQTAAFLGRIHQGPFK